MVVKPSTGKRYCPVCATGYSNKWAAEKRASEGRGPHTRGTRNQYCPQGHLFDEVNTMVNGRGHRICRTCRKLRGARSACPKGHPYDESNTEINSRGHRMCRMCRSPKSGV